MIFVRGLIMTRAPHVMNTQLNRIKGARAAMRRGNADGVIAVLLHKNLIVNPHAATARTYFSPRMHELLPPGVTPRYSRVLPACVIDSFPDQAGTPFPLFFPGDALLVWLSPPCFCASPLRSPRSATEAASVYHSCRVPHT